MKKIFVTVAEFLENGGNIPLDTPIYLNEYGYQIIGDFVKDEHPDIIRIRTSSSEAWPFDKKLCWIEILCVPMWVATFNLEII